MSQRRVVVTGMGIVSSIGNDVAEVTASLRAGRSGIVRAESYAEHGFRCQVHGEPTADPSEHVDRRAMRLPRQGHRVEPHGHGPGHRPCRAGAGRDLQRAHRHHHGVGRPLHAHHRGGFADRAREGLAEAHRPLRRAQGHVVDRQRDAGHALRDPRRELHHHLGLLDHQSLHRLGHRADPLGASRTACSPAAARTSTGRCRAYSTRWAPCRPTSTTCPPRRAARSRPTATASSSPAARASSCWRSWRSPARAAPPSSPRSSATAPRPTVTTWSPPRARGAVRCMRQALEGFEGGGIGPVDYINPHATATPVGDAAEVGALREVFGADCPPISGTKSMTGHAQGATGVTEAIYCLTMMREGFIAPVHQHRRGRPRLRRHAHRARDAGRGAIVRAVELVRLSAAPTPRWRSGGTMADTNEALTVRGHARRPTGRDDRWA